MSYEIEKGTISNFLTHIYERIVRRVIGISLIIPSVSVNHLYENARNFEDIVTDNAGDKVILAVPEGKQWTIYSLYVVRQSGSTTTFSQILADDISTGDRTLLQAFSAASSKVFNNDDNVQGLVLEEGDSLLLNFSGANGDTFTVEAWLIEVDKSA